MRSSEVNPYDPPSVEQDDAKARDQTTDQASHRGQMCYISTPAHNRSFIGRFLYIYTGTGTIKLTDESLQFTYKAGDLLEIPIGNITDVSRGSFSRWAKPLRLDYIAVTYQLGHTPKTNYFTPTTSPATPTWKTNEQVGHWISKINDARTRQSTE